MAAQAPQEPEGWEAGRAAVTLDGGAEMEGASGPREIVTAKHRESTANAP